MLHQLTAPPYECSAREELRPHRLSGVRSRPVGSITRGTTNPNRWRRCDQWLVATMGSALRPAQSLADATLDFRLGGFEVPLDSTCDDHQRP